MATEIYQPPQELPVTTVVTSLPSPNGTSVYDDPNDQLFLGDLQIVTYAPMVA